MNTATLFISFVSHSYPPPQVFSCNDFSAVILFGWKWLSKMPYMQCGEGVGNIAGRTSKQSLELSTQFDTIQYGT